jgi:hypothetical protein
LKSVKCWWVSKVRFLRDDIHLFPAVSVSTVSEQKDFWAFPSQMLLHLSQCFFCQVGGTFRTGCVWSPHHIRGKVNGLSCSSKSP